MTSSSPLIDSSALSQIIATRSNELIVSSLSLFKASRICTVSDAAPARMISKSLAIESIFFCNIAFVSSSLAVASFDSARSARISCSNFSLSTFKSSISFIMLSSFSLSLLLTLKATPCLRSSIMLSLYFICSSNSISSSRFSESKLANWFNKSISIRTLSSMISAISSFKFFTVSSQDCLTIKFCSSRIPKVRVYFFTWACNPPTYSGSVEPSVSVVLISLSISFIFRYSVSIRSSMSSFSWRNLSNSMRSQ
mmetsp:Transcript_20354/g.30606  ORF Transcript_20354/g.30606 Transcript_20354/m.30606 type:complete len:253 (+) Transcript_20354:1943-2701(+)